MLNCMRHHPYCKVDRSSMLALILVSLINDPILLHKVRWVQIESGSAHRLTTMPLNDF